jgi:hypothetical protein
MHQSRSFSARKFAKWCITCTIQRRFRPRSSQNGASRAPIKVVFGLESSKTVHHVRHSAPISARELTEWCTTCTNQGRFRLGSSQNGAPHAPISADFGQGAPKMVHHVHQSRSFSARKFAKWCITCTIQRRFGPRSSQNGASRAPFSAVSGQGAPKMVHHVHQSAPISAKELPKWCITCTNQSRFRLGILQNGAPRAPMSRESTKDRCEMAH